MTLGLGLANASGRIGLDGVRAELLPEDKVRAVDELVAEYGGVAMLGDGVNDAPAMIARATFGIAMAAAGSDAAIETADVALMWRTTSLVFRGSSLTRDAPFARSGRTSLRPFS